MNNIGINLIGYLSVVHYITYRYMRNNIHVLLFGKFNFLSISYDLGILIKNYIIKKLYS